MTDDQDAMQVVVALFQQARDGTLSDDLFLLAHQKLCEAGNLPLAHELAGLWKSGRMSADRSLGAVLDYVNRVKDRIFFLQIGVMDGVSFDGMFPYIRQFGWDGILVEPLPDMIAKARMHYQGHSGQLFFENVAISEQVESRAIYRIPEEVVQQAGLPDWTLGIASLRPGHFQQLAPYMRAEMVSCVPLQAVVEKYRPESIDVVLIDTEGYDYTILRQFDFSRYHPLLIKIEAVHLPAAERQALMGLLVENRYLFYAYEQDFLAIRQDLFFGLLWSGNRIWQAGLDRQGEMISKAALPFLNH